jgi:hypothetical protein
MKVRGVLSLPRPHSLTLLGRKNGGHWKGSLSLAVCPETETKADPSFLLSLIIKVTRLIEAHADDLAEATAHLRVHGNAAA